MIGKNMRLDEYIRDKRKLHNLTQQELAERAGVGYRFVRELENGKPTVRMDKVNQVLNLFGEELQSAKISDDWQIIKLIVGTYWQFIPFNRFEGGV